MNFFKNLELSFRKLNHQRIQLFRIGRTQFLRVLFNTTNKDRKAVDQLTTVVFLRLDGKLGDTITFSAFVQQMVKNCPQLEIHILTRKNSSEVYQYLFPELMKNQQIILHFVDKNIFKIYKTLNDLKPIIFDALISTSHILDPQSIILARFIRAKSKISFLNTDMKFFDQFVTRNFFSMHITERYKNVVQFLKLNWTEPAQYSFVVPQQQLETTSQFLEKIKKQKNCDKIIVLNSFAAARLRNLNFETTLTIIKLLSDKIPTAVIASIANSGDLKILKNWRSQAETDPRFQGFIKNWFFSDQTSILDTAAMIDLSDLVITPDTSIVHLASALKTPLIALFRPDTGTEENSKIWSPIGSNFKVLFSQKNDDILGLNTIDTGTVTDAAKNIINMA